MAVKELAHADYDSIKASLANGQSINTVAKAFKLGNRRVALIAKSKSWNSYIALRAVERRKRAENTPAKAVAGAHDLGDPEAEVSAFLDENNKPVPADGEPADESNDPVDKEFETTIAEVTNEAEQAKLRAAFERRAMWLGLGIIAAIVIVVVAIIWGAIYLITK